MIPRTLFTSDHEAFRDTLRKFLEKEAVPHHARWEEEGQVSRELWLKAGENGFLCPSSTAARAPTISTPSSPWRRSIASA